MFLFRPIDTLGKIKYNKIEKYSKNTELLAYFYVCNCERSW